MRLLVETRDKLRKTDSDEGFGDAGVIERAVGCRVGDGNGKRSERKIRPLDRKSVV